MAEETADEEFERLMEHSPGDYQALCRLGFDRQQAGLLDEARRCYEAAQKSAPPSPELAHNLGMVYWRLGDPRKARDCLERALALRPDALPTLDALARIRQEGADLDGAISCYERALSIDPHHHRAFAGMGQAFAEAGWEEDAIRAFETALAIEPDQLEASNGLGILYLRQGRFDLAKARFDHVLARCPDDTGVRRNQAMLLGAQGRFGEEEAVYREILARDPHDAEAHFGLASVLLLTGRLPEGWREYEWRFAPRPSGEAVRSPPDGLPRWSGEAVARQSSGLVIYAEQGFGDAIQFCRFAPLAAERFGRVCLHTRRPLLGLFERSFGALCEVVAELPDERGYTHHCPLMSLPLALGTTMETIPAAVPYLRPDAEKCRRWREALAGESRLKTGVVWTTGKHRQHRKSFELCPSLLAPLLTGVDVCWVSLNKEAPEPARAAVPRQAGVIDWAGELNDFDDTAALVMALDLVISVDTAVAHLAGALGKPVWLLNRAGSEWRWLLERSDSPWYPSMRIFRQRRRREWEPVLRDVAEALRSTIQGAA
ncbi:MAG: tetratricopeptide repeat protein [Candidatus Accumulibacter sp.]|jgi:Flp pilus assembly protein TadD|nr:tetratricopeptide repeat protein [Accumulibacter sp.]